MADEPITIGNDLDDITDAMGGIGGLPDSLTEPEIVITEDDVHISDNDDGNILDFEEIGLVLNSVGQDEEYELKLDRISSVLNMYLTAIDEQPISKETIDLFKARAGIKEADGLTSFLTSKVSNGNNYVSLTRLLDTFINDNKDFLLSFINDYLEQVSFVGYVNERTPKDLDSSVDSLSSMVTNMENIYLRRDGKPHVVIYEEPLSVVKEVLEEDGNTNPYFTRLYELCEKLNVTDKSIINIVNLYGSVYKTFKEADIDNVESIKENICKVTTMLESGVSDESLPLLSECIRKVILGRVANLGNFKTYGVLNTIFMDDTNIFELVKNGCIGAI